MVGWVCTTLNYMNESDLLIEPYPLVKAGGQHVTTTRSAIQVTHIPSGLVAICNTERSQLRNRDVAIAMIEAGLEKINYKSSIPPKPEFPPNMLHSEGAFKMTSKPAW